MSRQPQGLDGTGDEVRLLSAPNLRSGGIRHGFFLRCGGVSEGVYDSLNCGRGSNDEKERVETNRARAAEALGVASEVLIGPRQIHSEKTAIVTRPWRPADALEADAVVTAEPGIALCVLTADCAPILLSDAQAGIIAAVHAGWKGAKGGVIESAIEAMESLGANSSRIAAAIGPAISQAAYEVSPEFEAGFVADSEANALYFEQGPNGRPHFNLPAYAKDRLMRRGVTNIQDLALCTYKNESILFSFRRTCHRSEADYGRQISAIVLG